MMMMDNYQRAHVRFFLKNKQQKNKIKRLGKNAECLLEEFRLETYYSPSSFSSKTGLLEELFAPILFFHLAQ